jgi:hypothetical protein
MAYHRKNVINLCTSLESFDFEMKTPNQKILKSSSFHTALLSCKFQRFVSIPRKFWESEWGCLNSRGDLLNLLCRL